MQSKFKISITGPESTGKTTLFKALIAHYKAYQVEDYSRTFFKNKSLSNKYEDIILIAKQQIKLEIKAVNHASQNIIICDTDLINIKIWLEYYNYEVPPFLEDHLRSYPNHFNLLLYPNTVWQKDELRKNEKDRLHLFEQFEQELLNYAYKYAVIKKLDAERMHQAIIEINKALML